MDGKKSKNGDEQKERGRFEERLDRAAEKFTKSMGDAVKRMEDAFEKSKESIKESTSISDRYKHLFNYPTGGFLLVVIGFVWLMYTLGFFDHVIFPIILIIIGLYMVLKRRS